MTPSHAPTPFQLLVRREARVIDVRGEFDVAAVPAFEAAARVLRNDADGDIEVTFDEATFVDAAALGALVALSAAQVLSEASLVVRGIRPTQRRVFELGRVTHLLEQHRWARASWFRPETSFPLARSA